MFDLIFALSEVEDLLAKMVASVDPGSFMGFSPFNMSFFSSFFLMF